MRLHTSIGYGQLHRALQNAKEKGRVAYSVGLVKDDHYKSQTHFNAFEVQLGSFDKHDLPPGTRDQFGKKMNVRRYKNSGGHGATSAWGTGENLYAATYDEWGWFIVEVFKMDPHARFGPRVRPGKAGWGTYDGPADFNKKTGDKFKEDV